MLKLKPLLSTRWGFAPLYAGLVAGLLAAQLNGCGETHGRLPRSSQTSHFDPLETERNPGGESAADTGRVTPLGDASGNEPTRDGAVARDAFGSEQSSRTSRESSDASRAFPPASGNLNQARTVDFSSAYYQRDERLADLFSDHERRAGESMLCWPVALVYQTRYQASMRSPRVPELSKLLTPAGDPSQDVRSFMELCKTDRNDGTTMPKGARCIDALYKRAGLRAAIEVIGVDAMWADYGMYPSGTQTQDRGVALADVMKALDRDDSVIALIGFYQLAADGKTWTRYSGHFLSITGYESTATDSNEPSALHVVNPAVRYDSAPGTPKFDRIQVRRLATLDSTYPENLTYEMSGNGVSFTSYTTILESLVVFSASAP